MLYKAPLYLIKKKLSFMETNPTTPAGLTPPAVTEVAQNLVQWNLRVPSETKDLIIKKATEVYSMSVPEFVIGKCLDTLPIPIIASGANIAETLPVEHANFDTENEALNNLVRRLNAQILGLVAENQELKEKLLINAQAPAVAVIPVNEFSFIVSPELKTMLDKFEAHRTEKEIKPAFKDCFEFLLLSWSEDMYNNFDFTKNTGVDFSELKTVLKVQREYVNTHSLAMGTNIVEKK
jgi:hypothetical protein